jgi:hypothetical protein
MVIICKDLLLAQQFAVTFDTLSNYITLQDCTLQTFSQKNTLQGLNLQRPYLTTSLYMVSICRDRLSEYHSAVQYHFL